MASRPPLTLAQTLAQNACAFPGTRYAEFTNAATLSGRAQLRAELRAVLDAGGEGMMIQPAHNPYTPGGCKRRSLLFLTQIP